MPPPWRRPRLCPSSCMNVEPIESAGLMQEILKRPPSDTTKSLPETSASSRLPKGRLILDAAIRVLGGGHAHAVVS